MTIHTKRVYRLRSVEESTFATDQTASMSGFEPLDFVNATVSYELPRPLSGVMQQKMDSASQRVNLLKRATLTVTCNLMDQPSRAGDNDTVVQSELGKLFRCWLGGRRLGTGDDIGSGSTTSEIVLNTSARWEAGAGVGVYSGGKIVARQIVSQVMGGFSVWPDLEAGDVPASSDIAYAAASYYLGPSADDDSDNTTLQFACEGLATFDRFLLLGGKVTNCSFSLGRGQIAQATFTIQFVNWLYGEDCATDLTSDTAPLSYDATANNGFPLSVIDSDLIVVSDEGTDTDAIHSDSLTIECSPQWVMVNSTTGPGGCGAIGWARNQSQEVVKVSWTHPFESRRWAAIRDEQDEESWIQVHFQLGSADGCMLFNVKAQVTNVQPVEVNGLSYERVDAVGGIPITTDTTKINDSPFVIHMF